jgi:signal transduction histidine kinase
VIVRWDLAEDLPAVDGDRVQLQQVILNLVLNAADAMSEVDDRPRDLLVATARDDEGRVRLSVRDAGAGFDPADAGKLFEPFYTTKAEGMGIGLSISRSIVESHEGVLAAAANEGPGATFSFWIPARHEPADRRETAEDLLNA